MKFMKFIMWCTVYVTGSEKISLIVHLSRFDFSSWAEGYVNKLLNFIFRTIKLHLSGLLLLAAFQKHSGNLYEWSGVQMESWDSCEWLYSSVVLNKGVCCKFPFILAGLKTCVAHILTWCILTPFPLKISNHRFARLHPCHPPMLELTWYSQH